MPVCIVLWYFLFIIFIILLDDIFYSNMKWMWLISGIGTETNCQDRSGSPCCHFSCFSSEILPFNSIFCVGKGTMYLPYLVPLLNQEISSSFLVALSVYYIYIQIFCLLKLYVISAPSLWSVKRWSNLPASLDLYNYKVIFFFINYTCIK